MSEERFQTFEEFWPFYLNEHSKASTRWIHFVGTHVGIVALIAALVTFKLWLFPAGVAFAYLMAWTSHFFIEKNKPATFDYPAWSFKGDFRMIGYMWTGKIKSEVAQHVEVTADATP